MINMILNIASEHKKNSFTEKLFIQIYKSVNSFYLFTFINKYI